MTKNCMVGEDMFFPRTVYVPVQIPVKDVEIIGPVENRIQTEFTGGFILAIEHPLKTV